ncbi:MAG: ribonuclease Z [Candidatus Heimdallarchaeota archaeon]|nr:ribonuclease Z [Candidatus Heimdallarchaeota archaeon]
MSEKIKITFLGTGSAIPPNDRFQVSTALRHKHGLILFDCGEGTQYLIRKYSISIKKEILICISHLHSDHFLGLPGLLASLQLLHYSGNVTILGPIYTRQVVSNLLKSAFVTPDFPLDFVEIGQDEVFHGKGFTISAIDAVHEAKALSYIWKEDDKPGKINMKKLETMGVTAGPLVGQIQQGKSITVNGTEIFPTDIIGEKRKGRIVVYSGDTAPNQNLALNLREGCDLLIHEATYPSSMEELANERDHSTFRQAASIALFGRVKTLYLTHISPRVKEVENELLDAREIFQNTFVAVDGHEFIL